VLGASYNDVAANRAFAEKFQFPYRLLCDTEHVLGPTYGVDDPSDPGFPRRISYLIGPDRRIVKIYDPVDVTAHAAQVLADI